MQVRQFALKTALCPICSIDSVMPLTVEQFDSDFLEQMHHYWFEMGVPIKGPIVRPGERG